MKKLLLSLGAVAAVAAPVAAVVACGSDNGDSAAKTKAIAEFKNLSNYDSMSKTDQAAFDKSMNAMSLDQINKSIEGLKGLTGGTPTGTPAGTGTGTAGTPAGIGTAGTPAVVQADGYDESTNTVAVTINIDENDFESHVAGEAALAIEKFLDDAAKTTADVEHVTITIIDGTETESVTKDVDMANTNANTRVNLAINAAAEDDALSDAAGHELALGTPDYLTKVEARINGVDDTVADFELANELFDAVGNATRFTDATHMKLAFGTIKAMPSVKTEMQKMLDRLLEIKDQSLIDAFQAQIDKMA